MLEGKVCVVTGGASGIGRAIALAWARDGARVIVSDLASASAGGEQTAELARGAGAQAEFVAADVAREEDCAALVARTVERFGRLDVACNNAGIGGALGPVADYRLEEWQRVLAVNLTGVFLCMKHQIPAMLAAGGGSIVNVASFVAHLGAATPQIAYTASKGAVLAMTREMAAIYARRGVRANALCPGPVMTPLLAKFLSDDAKRERRLVHIPMGRFGEPHEIVNGALFLASNESSWMTGQSLIIDGGITSAYVTPEGPAWS